MISSNSPRFLGLPRLSRRRRLITSHLICTNCRCWKSVRSSHLISIILIIYAIDRSSRWRRDQGWKWMNIRFSRKPRKVPFIKLSIFADDLLSGNGVIEQPSLILLRISNEDTLLSMRTESLSLVLLDMHIGSTSKNPKIGNIRFLLVHESPRNRVRDS